MRKLDLAGRVGRGTGFGRTGIGAVADRHQVSATSWRPTPRRDWRPKKFKELAEKYTDGKVKARSIRTRSSTRTRKSWRRCSLALCRCWRPRTRNSSRSGSKEFEVFDLPYILPDLTTLRKVTDVARCELLKLLDAKGMTGLAYWDNGFKQMSANRKLHCTRRLQGSQIPLFSPPRCSSAIPRARFVPQVMGFGEVYQALQTRVVDGQENTWSNIYTQKNA